MGGAYDIDDALEGVRWSLATRADLYPVIPGCKSLRAIRTDEFRRVVNVSPVLRIYFRILSDDLVELAWIETVI